MSWEVLHSQFGELGQGRDVLYMHEVVVLHVQVGEVGGTGQVGDVRYLVVIQVQDCEISTHREVILQEKSS